VRSHHDEIRAFLTGDLQQTERRIPRYGLCTVLLSMTPWRGHLSQFRYPISLARIALEPARHERPKAPS
jgi:hypothetical protein